MAKKQAFTKMVAARTRAANHILNSPELMTRFTKAGGLAEDLEAIRDAGLEAEALNHAQGSMQSSGKVATVAVGIAFGTLQREYVLLLAALRAIEGRLLQANASDPNAEKLADIIANRAAVTVSEGTEEGAAKKASKSRAQENLRAEIERDAADVIAFTAIASALTQRGWTANRLSALEQAAKALAGKLGDRAASKGAAKDATLREQEAVARQTAGWESAYSLLRIVAQQDARVQLLLTEARR